MAVTVAVTRETASGRRLLLAAWAVSLAALLLIGAVCDAGAALSYPRLVNIYFGSLGDTDLDLLSQWDLLVLSKRAEDIHQAELAELRACNPEVTLLAHIAVGYGRDFNAPPINADLSAALSTNNWWMLNTEGERLVFGPGNIMMNMSLDCPVNAEGQRLCDWLPEYIVERLYSGGRWDGLFLDYSVDRVSWLDRYLEYPIDHDLDGLAADGAVLDESWRLGMRECISKIRDLVGDDFLLVGNGNNTLYDVCDGDTREDFPNMHGSWYDNMMDEEHGYLAFEALYRKPTTNIINHIWDGALTPDGPLRGGEFDREFLFGLTSTLAFGSGYFSCDGPGHSEVWWFEYYDVDLGQPLGRAEDVDVPEGSVPPWVDLTELIKKRRFDNGIAVINPCLWVIDIPLGGAYYDIHSWNGQFYEFGGLRTTVEVSWRGGEVLVGTGVVPAHKIDSANAVASRDAVILTWDAVDGASSYSIYRAKVDSVGSPQGKMLITVADEPFYVDRDLVGASNYRYYIAPIDRLNCEGRQSLAIEVSAEPGSDLSIALIIDEFGGPPVLRSDSGEVSDRTAFAGVWPQPITEQASVAFTLADDAQAGTRTTRLSVYDVAGRLVRCLEDGPLGPGRHVRRWDLTSDAGAAVASGCYFFVLERGCDRVTSKALVLR